MAIEFKLPELGENIDTADISKVLVKPGDSVKVDQILFEIETDKATVEVPSDIEGVVTEVRIKEGDTVNIGDVVIVLDSSGEAAKEKPTADVPESKETASEPEPVEKIVEDSAPVQESASGSFEFRLPELGENIESADVAKVLVKAGDVVKKDQTLIEIETDKATIEVPSELSGTVEYVNVKDGDNIKVGEVILTLATSGTPAVKSPQQNEEGAEKPAAAPEAVKSIPATELPKASAHTPVPSRSAISKKVVPASPSVRRFAREIGVDIHKVSGTGPGGRISVDDVKKYAKSLNEKIEKGGFGFGGFAPEALPDFSKFGEIKREKMSNVRKKTAAHLSAAWTQIPHVTQFDKADITELEKIRKQYKDQVENAGGKLTITSILAKVIAEALKRFPNFNASVDMQNNEIIYKKYVNVGIAADTPKGLLVPVFKIADKKGIAEISVELTELSKKARDGKLSLEEMQGGNFSISNLGGMGGTYFTPIINSPESGILGVSRSEWEQVYIDGEFVPRFIMPLSLSYDHRIIDGADAVRFLRWVIEALESPFGLLL